MTELELQLARLGGELQFPPTPDLSGAVRRRLAARRPRLSATWRRVLLVTLALLAVAIGAALAVPSARTTILKWFHLRGVTVERVETLPRASERPLTAGLGRPVTFAQAARAVGFRIVLPPLERPRVYITEDGLASILLRSTKEAGSTPLLLSEFRSHDFTVLKKAANGQTRVEQVRVNGQPGLWVAGAPHVLTYVDRSGRYRERPVLVTGNVLVWQRGQITLRLEGKLTEREALRTARAMR